MLLMDSFSRSSNDAPGMDEFDLGMDFVSLAHSSVESALSAEDFGTSISDCPVPLESDIVTPKGVSNALTTSQCRDLLLEGSNMHNGHLPDGAGNSTYNVKKEERTMGPPSLTGTEVVGPSGRLVKQNNVEDQRSLAVLGKHRSGHCQVPIATDKGRLNEKQLTTTVPPRYSFPSNMDAAFEYVEGELRNSLKNPSVGAAELEQLLSPVTDHADASFSPQFSFSTSEEPRSDHNQRAARGEELLLLGAKREMLVPPVVDEEAPTSSVLDETKKSYFFQGVSPDDLSGPVMNSSRYGPSGLSNIGDNPGLSSVGPGCSDKARNGSPPPGVHVMTASMPVSGSSFPSQNSSIPLSQNSKHWFCNSPPNKDAERFSKSALLLENLNDGTNQHQPHIPRPPYSGPSPFEGSGPMPLVPKEDSVRCATPKETQNCGIGSEYSTTSKDCPSTTAPGKVKEHTCNVCGISFAAKCNLFKHQRAVRKFQTFVTYR